MISGADKAFLRDYEVDSTQTFLHFHKVIQENLGYDPNQLASFFLADENWNKGLELTLIDMENDDGPAAIPMNSVRICDVLRTKKERLLYVYDLFTDNYFFFELMDIFKPIIGVEYPICSALVGDPPAQFDIEGNELINKTDDTIIEDIYKEFDNEEFDYGSEGQEGVDDDL